MKIDILTLFPEMFEGPFDSSIIKRARENGFAEINIHNLRDWTKDNHKTVDDKPYGGGPGMIMRVDIIDSAVKDLMKKSKVLPSRQTSKGLSEPKALKSRRQKLKVILLSANGKTYDQRTAKKLSLLDNIILIAGHYEGVDHRVDEHIADEVISIGNYVLTGGEIPSMVLVDSIVRLIPGVLNPESLKHESFSSLEIRNSKSLDSARDGEPVEPLEIFKEYPQYTRPENYKGWKVPKILLSGHHEKIINWRKKKTKA